METIEVFGDPNIGIKEGKITMSVEFARILEHKVAQLQKAIEVINKALYEIGTPQPGYPQPIANAHKILNDFLSKQKEGDK